MIRSELVARLAAQNPHLPMQAVEAIVRTVLGRIADALAAGERVELRGFGVFEVRWREARPERNPQTGAAVEVTARATVHFKPGLGMRARLNPRPSTPEPVEESLRRAS